MRQLLAGLVAVAMTPGGMVLAADAPPQRVYLGLLTAKNSSSSCLKELAAAFKAEIGRRKTLVAARLRAESDRAVEVAACRARMGAESFGTVNGGTTLGGERTTWVRGEIGGNLGSYLMARLVLEAEDGQPLLEFSTGADPGSSSIADVVSAALDQVERRR